MSFVQNQQELEDTGFTVLSNIYTATEIDQILSAINEADTSNSTFRKSKDLFAIRHFLREIPDARELIFNSN